MEKGNMETLLVDIMGMRQVIKEVKGQILGLDSRFMNVDDGNTSCMDGSIDGGNMSRMDDSNMSCMDGSMKNIGESFESLNSTSQPISKSYQVSKSKMLPTIDTIW